MNAHRMTPQELQGAWDNLVTLEPRLSQLLAEVDRARRQVRAQDRLKKWYGDGPFRGAGLKDELTRLVGWQSKNDAVCGPEDYAVGYRFLTERLCGRRRTR